MFKILKVLSIGLLVMALGSWPYEYYTILRVVVCSTSIWCVIRYWDEGNESFAVTFGILALVFNPIAPIYLNKGLWTVIDLIAAGIYAYTFFENHNRK